LIYQFWLTEYLCTPSFQSIAGISLQNNCYQWHQPFCSTPPQDREWDDGGRDEDEDEHDIANQDNKNNEIGNDTDPEGWTNAA
jgi:hypothetical protein